MRPFSLVNLNIYTCLTLFLLFFNLFHVDISGITPSNLLQTSAAFNRVSQTSNASVVSISTVRTVQSYGFNPYINDPFFSSFRPHSGPPQQREGLGSGVIVSDMGHVLTNHHVIARADEITVTLSDGREFSASLVGSDKKTDLALLKVAATGLPVIALGNSDDLISGDWAIAIGNPFGLAGTMTVGIISATGRSGVVDAENYADFIQTDAAINPGNSGGALLNIQGELIGINTAIFSQNGGYMGIGFAIPVNMAKRVMDDLLEFGHVKRGSLGVTIQPITDSIMKKLRLSSRKGAYVIVVKPGSSADRAGIQSGDIIVELAGKKVRDYLSLRTRISELKLNEKSSCVIMRNNQSKRLELSLQAEPKLKRYSSDRLGIMTQELTHALRKQYRIPKGVSGLLITSVEQGSLAHRYRLRPGQVIRQINNKPVSNVDTYNRYVNQRKAVLLNLYQDGYEFSLVIR